MRGATQYYFHDEYYDVAILGWSTVISHGDWYPKARSAIDEDDNDDDDNNDGGGGTSGCRHPESF